MPNRGEVGTLSLVERYIFLFIECFEIRNEYRASQLLLGE